MGFSKTCEQILPHLESYDAAPLMVTSQELREEVLGFDFRWVLALAVYHKDILLAVGQHERLRGPIALQDFVNPVYDYRELTRPQYLEHGLLARRNGRHIPKVTC